MMQSKVRRRSLNRGDSRGQPSPRPNRGSHRGLGFSGRSEGLVVDWSGSQTGRTIKQRSKPRLHKVPLKMEGATPLLFPVGYGEGRSRLDQKN